MNHLQNLHTHTVFCDGRDTPEEMVRFALEKGFDSLGFSGHSPTNYSPRYAQMEDKLKKLEDYKREVNRLKEAYKDRLAIYLGLEVDVYCGLDLSGYDYLIGSVHYLKKDGGFLGFDRDAQTVQKLIDEHFEGDGMKFARRYYEELADIPRYGDFDIIGHFDIISKNLEAIPFFDENAKEYLDAAFEAMHALRGKIPLIEVNTGAIARGYRTVPYPSVPLLKELGRLGFGAVISSECHDGRYLDCQFEEARQLLAACGFKERYVLTENGFAAVAL